MLKKIIVILFIIALLVGVYFFATHPSLKLTDIKFQNQNFIPIIKLVSSTDEFKKKNIIWLFATSKIATKLYKDFQPIENIKIKLEFPSKAIITINEKKPWVAFIANGKTILVAQDGTVLSHDIDSKIENLENLIIIRGFPDSLFTGQYISKNILTNVGKVVNTIRQEFSRETFQMEFLAVEAAKTELSVDDLVLYMDDTLPIKVGSLKNIEDKLNAFKCFLNTTKINKNKIDYIDLRVARKVIVKSAI